MAELAAEGQTHGRSGPQTAGNRPGWRSGKSLRGRIFLSHLMVIGVAVVLTFAVALVPVRRSLTRQEIRRLQDIAAPAAAQTAYVMQRPALGSGVVDELLDLQSRQMGVRIILFDPGGTLQYDTGHGPELPSDSEAIIRETAQRLPATARTGGPLARIPLAKPGLFAGVSHNQRIVVAGVPQSNGHYIALLAPMRHLPLARELIAPLLLGAGVGILGAVLATVFLSRSIARPITRLTDAADAVAAGDLDHRVPGENDDEVGRLVHSFNLMVEQLRSTNESQRTLLANVAHELRTPLTSIQGYADALSDGVFASEADRLAALATIREESDRVNELVVQILQLARLESGQAELRLQPVNVGDLVERVLRRHRATATDAQVNLESQGTSVDEVLADETLLEQAVDNLVRNAIRHTPAGGAVRVAATITPGTANGQPLLRIRVSDTGSGIPPEHLPHVFDRFYRGKAAGGHDSGFGLGLAIVREIAMQHRGGVSVESAVGHGTSFAMEIPMHRPPEAGESSSGILQQPAGHLVD